MSYGADFATADPANAPLDGPLYIGADPFVLGVVLLGLLAALAVGYFWGARSNSRRPDAAQAIWEAINNAARTAMTVDDNGLKGRAENLLKVVEGRLGKTLIVAKGLSGRMGKLKDAVEGKGPAEAHDHGGGHGHGEGHGHGAGHGSGHGGGHGGGHGTHAPAHESHAAHEVHATPAVTIVNVNAGAPAPAPAHPEPHPHPPAHDAKPEKQELNVREQTDALRLAVAHFAEHWRDETARVGELRQAHAELSDPGSSRAATGRVSGARAGH